MGNIISEQVKSRSTGLGFFFSYSVDKYLIGFSRKKSIFIPKNSSPVGLAVISPETIPSNSQFIVFPPLIALQILYSAPGELWNWNHPKSRDFTPPPSTTTTGAHDGIIIPTNPDDIIRSEEYTCVVSIKDGHPIMTHIYGNTIIDSHPLPRYMVATTSSGGNRRPLDYEETSDDLVSEEFVKHCYICMGTNNKISDTTIHKDEAFGDEEGDKKETEAGNAIKETKN